MDVKTLKVGYLETNCYILFVGDGKALVIDPGGSYEAINKLLQSEGISEIAILLTHAHFDHIKAVKDLQENYKTKLYIHNCDKEALNGEGNLSEAMGLHLSEIIPDYVFDGEPELNIFGIKVKVLHTPGHTKGSVCYIIDDKIYSGDTLFYGSYGRTDFIGGNKDDMRKSLKKLFDLSGNYAVYPGHGNGTALSYEREYNPIVCEL